MTNIPKPKPIRRSSYGIISRTNVPYDEPLTPGLRRQRTANAIGFHASIVTDDQAQQFADRYIKRD